MQKLTKYQTGKKHAINQAILYQHYASEHNLSYSEIIAASEKLSVLAKRFGLVKEFKENGII